MTLIFHVDIDAFYAAVEELEQPHLRGQPLLVGGKANERGVIASVNEQARAFMVLPGMTTAQALRRCPKAIVIPPRIDLYRQYSKRVVALLSQYCPLIESFSIEEAYLDMTGQLSDRADPLKTAREIQKAIQTEVKLSVSIGIAANKLVARIASAYQRPGGLTYVPPGDEAKFLAPLPVEQLWGVGPKATKTLAEMGISAIGALARMPEEDLIKRFGARGSVMRGQAQGIDHRPVETERRIKSFSRETTFSRDIGNGEIIAETLHTLAHLLAYDLQRNNLTARTVILKLRYADFSTLTRSVTHDPATHNAPDIYHRAQSLLLANWNSARPLRMVGISVKELIEGVEQLSLF